MQQEGTPQIEQPTDAEPSTSEDRRAFLSRATGLAVTAPAATLLLAATTRRASARVGSVSQAEAVVDEHRESWHTANGLPETPSIATGARSVWFA